MTHITHEQILDPAIVFTPGHTDSKITEADDAFTRFLDSIAAYPLGILDEWCGGPCPYQNIKWHRGLMAKVWRARKLAELAARNAA